MKSHVGLEEHAQIQPEERDYNMTMHEADWGSGLAPTRWSLREQPARHFGREIPVHDDADRTTWLEELILPFPSAPIYGINRKTDYGKDLPDRPNMHSVRLLRRPETSSIHRLFILHNGLNETDSPRFYYQLADWIMGQQEVVEPREGVACLIMPFPGHLMHSTVHGPFSETPLSRYLNDSGDLYRQFLRYMIGFRWLLSIVSDSDAESWMVGGDLLRPSMRVNDLHSESKALHEMSQSRVARTRAMTNQQGGAPAWGESAGLGAQSSEAEIETAVVLLRSALDRDSEQAPPSLRIHVVGYSLGGFTAQSVFFAWPQVVSSCTTICSGGAISALSPTAFAHPEEWQSVLHALRPETANAMLRGRLAVDVREDKQGVVPVEAVAGMSLDQYGYFQRIFEQVFLQEDRGSYKERLSEYALRMFFVSGGEDPIVPPSNILDASPREGTTMLSVAGMTHFLNQDPRDDGDRREREQREFWLPEAGKLIARAAIHSEQVHLEEREQAEAYRAQRTRTNHWTKDISRESASALSDGFTFEAALDWVFEAVSAEEGWLFVSRNAIPAAFLPPSKFSKWGTGLHHHDVRVQRYALGLRHRRRVLTKVRDRTTLIVPEKLEHWFVDLSARFEPHSDSPSGRVTDERERRQIWRKFRQEWWGCTRHFNADRIAVSAEPGGGDVVDFAKWVGQWIGASDQFLEATHVPDVWISIRPDARLIAAKSDSRDRMHGEFVEGTARVIKDLVQSRDGGGHTAVYRKKLEDDLADGRIRIVQISGAEFNPRYRGELERRTSSATRLLARAAAALVRSRPAVDPMVVSDRESSSPELG